MSFDSNNTSEHDSSKETRSFIPPCAEDGTTVIFIAATVITSHVP
jgi:hypothetical protein